MMRTVSKDDEGEGERRTVRLSRDGADQVVRIPREFELAGESVVLVRDGDRLILEAVREEGLFDSLRSMGGWDEPFPDVDDDLPPLEGANPRAG